jgi:hypothetical protein
MTNTEFIQWWLSTQYGSMPEAQRVHWDRKGYKADVWPSFNQVANIQSGQPKVVCKQCGLMLDHPFLNGTSGMKRHKQRGNCQKKKGKQANIQHLMQKAVFIFD